MNATQSERYDPFEDSCVDCTYFERANRQCFLKGYTFTSHEAMRETAKHCWAFSGTDWKSTDPEKVACSHTRSTNL